MVIARICIPQMVLLTMPASAKEKDKGDPLFPPAGAGDPAEHILDRLDRTAEAETSGTGLDDEQEGEQLVRQLQAYFQKHTRYLLCQHASWAVTQCAAFEAKFGS